jgi:hypothetical protein
MPDIRQKFHGRRGERVVLREFELSGKHAAFERRALRALDQGFPSQEIVFRYGAGSYAIWGVVGEGSVLLEEAAVGGGSRHGVRRRFRNLSIEVVTKEGMRVGRTKEIA